MLPDNAPDIYYNRSALWNAVEQSERAKNAQLCREVRLALPNEFDNEQNEYLVHEYVRQNFVSRGMCADIAIHNKGDGNPHAHILLTMRPLEQDGTWGAKSRMEYILDDSGDRIKLPSGRYKTRKINTTDWDNRDNAELWRKSWADMLNKHLEHFSHETRVDHRSYERQGIEQIPTIHLGVAAHDMEQKGIATERGDINRSINAANARMQNINKEIRTTKKERHDILNPPPPPKPKLLIDLEKSVKAQNSVGYEKWAILFNLQQMAKTLIFIQENGYADMASLHKAKNTAAIEYNAMHSERPKVNDKLKDLRELKRQVEIYRRTKKVYDEWKAPGWIKHFQKQHYDKHKVDIEAHKSARAYIYDELKLTKFPSLKELSKEISELTARQKELNDTMPVTRERYDALNIAFRNADMILGYNRLENKGIDPTATHYNTPLYQSSFTQAKKSDELEQYFQSQSHNHNCAKAIKEAMPLVMNGYNKAIEDVTGDYGFDRIIWVLASVMRKDAEGNATNNASASNSITSKTSTSTSNPTANKPTSKLNREIAEHKDWLSVVELPNEPIPEYNLNCNAALSTFITQFQEYRRTFLARRAWEQEQTRSLSMADRMAVAKEKADEHNANREKPSIAKPKKNRGMDR